MLVGINKSRAGKSPSIHLNKNVVLQLLSRELLLFKRAIDICVTSVINNVLFWLSE